MPGIFGLASRSSKNINYSSIFKTMSRNMMHMEHYKQLEYLTLDGIALGSISVKSPFGVHRENIEGNEYILLIDGYIYQINDENVDPKIGETNTTIAKKILTIFHTSGVDAFHIIKGNYNIVIYDSAKEEMVVINDIFAPRRLYYAILEDMVIFAPEIKGLIGVPNFEKKINWKGVIDYFNYGYVLGDDTFFSAVKSLPSASFLLYKRKTGSISVAKYWMPEYIDRDISFHQTISDGIDLLQASIGEKAKTSHSIISPISGGLDSRIILGNLNSIDCDLSIVPITYGQKFSYEYKNASMVCRTIGLQGSHRLIEILPRSLISKYRQAVWLSEGMIPFTNVHLLLIPDAIGLDYDSLLNGIYGGPTNYSAEYYSERHLVFDSNIENKARDIQQVIAAEPQIYEGIFREPNLITYKEQAYNSIFQEFQKYCHVSDRFCNQRDAFFIENRMRRFICQSSLYGFFWEEQLPLSNYDLYKFYLSTPPQFKLKRGLLKAMLVKYYPDLGKIQDANTGLGVFEEPTKWYSMRRKLISDAKYYLTRLTMGGLSFYDKTTYAHYAKWFMNDRITQTFYADCLFSHAMREADFLDMANVRMLFEGVLKGKVGFHHLCRLTTFAIWYELFVLGRRTAEEVKNNNSILASLSQSCRK